MQAYHLLHRFGVDSAAVDRVRLPCSRSDRAVWIGPQRTGHRAVLYTFRGVPGARVDLLIPDCLQGQIGAQYATRDGRTLGPWQIACEIGRKVGRYDHHDRLRITFRDWMPPGAAHQPIPTARLFVEEAGDGLHFVGSWAGGMWGQCWPQMEWRRHEGDDPVAILIYEAIQWYGFLAPDGQARRDPDVRALAESWAALPAVQTEQDRAVLHRRARAALYDHAVRAGWRKLDVRQRQRIGLSIDSAAWQREERVAYLRERAGLGVPQGVGQHTLAAANGAAIHLPAGVCPQCQECDCDCRIDDVPLPVACGRIEG